MDEVRITREGEETAHIDFVDESIVGTRLSIGPHMRTMIDHEILACYDDGVRAQQYARASYEHIAVEIPVGKPQVQFKPLSNQWVPRGDVLRCVIDDGGPNGAPTIHIDDQELSWEEFGRTLLTYAGWGMRIKFVPQPRQAPRPRTDAPLPLRAGSRQATCWTA